MSDSRNWCPTCGKRPDDPEALFCSNSFHLSRPTPEPQGEAVAMRSVAEKVRDEIRPEDFGIPSDLSQRIKNYADYMNTRPQPGEGGGEVSDEMVEAAMNAIRAEELRGLGGYKTPDNGARRSAMRAALTAALSKGGQGGGE